MAGDPKAQLLALARQLRAAHLEKFSEEFSKVDDWKGRLAISESRGLGFAAPGGSFTQALLEACVQNKLGQRLTALGGKPLIELGAGASEAGYLFARFIGASVYIAVEPHYADQLEQSILKVRLNEDPPSLRFSVVPSDMLSFIGEAPPNSANILTCGIERCILPGDDYAQSVEAAIEHVVGTEHLFLSSQSDLFPPLQLRWEQDIYFGGRDRIDKLRCFMK